MCNWPLRIAAMLSVMMIVAEDSAGAAAQGTLSPASAFFAIALVLKSPRCQNCHTATSYPRQDDDRHPHRLNVLRGPDNHGAPGLRCSTCHADHNNAASGVPGAPHWGVAPLAQQWETLDPDTLCRQIVDPKTNGGRSLDMLEKHLNEDPLVQWAWHPGNNAAGRPRTPPPIDQDQFHALIRTWIAGGAQCPN